MSQQPSCWELVKLCDLVSSAKTGLVRSAEQQGSDKPFPYLKMNNLNQEGKFNYKPTSFIDASQEEIESSKLENGDFIFNTRNSAELVGKCGIYQIPAKFSSTPVLYNNNLLKIKFNFIDPRIFSYWLLSPHGKALLNEVKSATTSVAAIYQRDLMQINIPLPPLAEQTRIAQKLDELLAQVDTLKGRIDAIPALLKRFRQSVLAAAVSGRLTEEWRSSNPANESAEKYLARVIQSRRQNSIVKFKEPVSPDLEKREMESPEGWIVASVSSFAECLDSMRVPVKKELRKSGEGKYPYFGANGEVDRVDEYIFDDDLVLVTEDETFYGREKPIAYKYSGKCWVNNHVHALRAQDSVARDYLCYALMHYDVIPWLTGTTGRAKLTQGALLSLPIQVPPSAEQTEIVRRVEQLFAFADQLEAKIQTAQARVNHLTQSILAKAFRGELVPQDPNDEPASVLLQRIQAQRAAAPKAKRGRKSISV